ncbi:hypothetical protein [Desulfovibrio sp. ZJ200]|uniref:hypothetical protein n=1 Tax=Desulfovibrio sp. ZJ200 TaxID=2709792 RepID=UPI0013EA07B4|nr:hypothetical protein [Desulfovibrio sp. ZJ200]
MTLPHATEKLRRRLRQWAVAPEWALLVRYELLPQKPAPELRKRCLQKLGRLLRVLGLSRARYQKQVWQAGLTHAPAAGNKILLIWSDVPDKVASRAACRGLQGLLAARPAYIPVLVTPLADFAFYSRLGWLVEYLPEIPGTGPEYAGRKRRYLAWRYRDAVAVPLSAGLCGAEDFARLVPS